MIWRKKLLGLCASAASAAGWEDAGDELMAAILGRPPDSEARSAIIVVFGSAEQVWISLCC
jgi:hypothetical protein